MNTSNAIDLLFGGMEKLGPGSDADTLQVLRRLPQHRLNVIVDAGCGAGRQTIVLAKELDTPVHAIDTYEPFLNELKCRAAVSGVGNLIHAHCMDMKDIPKEFSDIDLLWSEGAAYNIGFAYALRTWARAIKPRGLAVVSELAWLTERVPDAARAFFRSGYPDMRQATQNISVAESTGYNVLDTYILPRKAWVEGYYDILEQRAKALADYPDSSVSKLAHETLKEIEVFNSSGDSFGYVFYVLQRA